MSGSRAGGFEALAALAPAKINLGLFVGEVRGDGRHELASVMQSISLCDELELEPADDGPDELRCPGVDGAAAENLALRALAAFRERARWDRGAARVSVVKRIPVAAGLGGGSADAAAVLRLAAAASGLGDEAQLREIARGLGADVPAQVSPGRWLARGAGERLEQLPEVAPFGVLVLPSNAALSTAAVYAELDRRGGGRSAAELAAIGEALRDALGGGAGLPPPELLQNDLQAPALALEPSIERALEHARRAGADHAIVSGSGPTVLGLFGGADGVERCRRAAEELMRSWHRLPERERPPTPIAATPVGTAYGAAAPRGRS
jgi:4-diphosphocytidyl-2-C-methyl-D-erythritol kinase